MKTIEATEAMTKDISNRRVTQRDPAPANLLAPESTSISGAGEKAAEGRPAPASMQERTESTRRYVQGLEEFKAQAMASLLDATYSALDVPAKPLAVPVALEPQTANAGIASNQFPPQSKYITKGNRNGTFAIVERKTGRRVAGPIEDEDDAVDCEKVWNDEAEAAEPHHAGDDENLTREELER